MKRILSILLCLTLSAFGQDVAPRPVHNGKHTGTADFSAISNKSTVRGHLGITIGTDVLAPNGNGSALTALNANELTSGTVPDARFPATLPALNGSALTSITAANIAGIVAGANGGTGVANSGKTITLGGNLVTTGAYNLTVALGASVTMTTPTTDFTAARTDAAQTFTGAQTFGAIVLASLQPASDSTTAIQWFKANGSSGVFSFDTTNGRMSIGVVTAPTAILELAGTVSSGGSSIVARNNSPGGYGGMQVYSSGGFLKGLVGWGNASVSVTAFQGKMVVASRSTDDLILGTNDVTRVTINGSNGNATFANGIIRTPQALTTNAGGGTVDLVTAVTKVTTTGVGDVLGLGNGTDGQIKTVVHDVDGGSWILTPVTATGWTTATSTTVGQSVTVQYFTTRGWMVIGSYGVTIAP